MMKIGKPLTDRQTDRQTDRLIMFQEACYESNGTPKDDVSGGG